MPKRIEERDGMAAMRTASLFITQVLNDVSHGCDEMLVDKISIYMDLRDKFNELETRESW